jgi:hypothetical protein
VTYSECHIEQWVSITTQALLDVSTVMLHDCLIGRYIWSDIDMEVRIIRRHG